MTLPGIAVGAGLYAAGLGADGIGPLAVRSAGYSPVIFFDGSSMWVNGIFMAATAVFALGLLSLVVSSIRLGLLRQAHLVADGLSAAKAMSVGAG